MAKDFLKTAFGWEWLAVAALGAVDAMWAAQAGFHIVVGWSDGAQIASALAAAIVLRFFAMKRGGLTAEFFALFVAGTVVTCVLSYLCLSASGSLIDDALLKADRALGFDWLKVFHFVIGRPWLASAAATIYDSLIYQCLFLGIFLGLANRWRELREIFWIVFLATLLTDFGALLFPALGAYKAFGLESYGFYLPEMEHLRSGRDLSFVLSRMTGVVVFPSFHTTMALTMIYAFRRTGFVGWIVAVWNGLMLLTIPACGGHYLVDMFAGAAVMAVTTLAARFALGIGKREGASRRFATNAPSPVSVQTMEPSA
jgi:hypothetical protein